MEDVQFFFCWKDILLYGDTYHLILRFRAENEKVKGGDICVQEPTETKEKTFFLVQGTPEGYETSAARSFVLLRRTPRAPGISDRNPMESIFIKFEGVPIRGLRLRELTDFCAEHF